MDVSKSLQGADSTPPVEDTKPARVRDKIGNVVICLGVGSVIATGFLYATLPSETDCGYVTKAETTTAGPAWDQRTTGVEVTTESCGVLRFVRNDYSRHDFECAAAVADKLSYTTSRARGLRDVKLDGKAFESLPDWTGSGCPVTPVTTFSGRLFGI